MKKLNGFLFLIIPALMATGCSTFKRQGTVRPAAEPQAPELAVSAPTPSEGGQYGDITIMTNQHVRQWIGYFQGRGRHHMERYLTRSTRYTQLMQDILRKHGLPEDLIYIPLIESGFSAVAHSHASAVGYWQFIRGTGKRYGLKIDPFVDERRDPVRSTEAAAEYFKSLYTLFGDWYLALAAYNVGENRVKNALMRYNSRDFWSLVDKRKLPRETRNYVPKFLAASIIAKDPKRFGFDAIDYSPALAYDEVDVKQPVSLITLANELDIPYRELKKMNPRYRTDYVPIYDENPSKVRVPPGYQNAALAALPKSIATEPRVVVREFFHYRVRRGDTLGGIASRHRTSVSSLRGLNNLGSRTFLRVGQRLRVPERAGVVERFVASGESSFEDESPIKPAAAAKAGIITAEAPELVQSDFFLYRVQKGDTLSTIAQKHHVTLLQLRRANKMRRRTALRVGQKLKIPGRQANGTSNRFHRLKRGETPRTHRFHVVKRGETLNELSRKYGVTLSSLVRANELAKGSRLATGVKLVIPQ